MHGVYKVLYIHYKVFVRIFNETVWSEIWITYVVGL